MVLHAQPGKGSVETAQVIYKTHFLYLLKGETEYICDQNAIPLIVFVSVDYRT